MYSYIQLYINVSPVIDKAVIHFNVGGAISEAFSGGSSFSGLVVQHFFKLHVQLCPVYRSSLILMCLVN